MKPLYIFDLDGTLVDIRHRRHLVQLLDGSAVVVGGDRGTFRGPNDRLPGDVWVEFPGTGKWSFCSSNVKFTPDWPAFFKACVRDTAIVPVAATAHALLQAGCEVRVWSGRSDEVVAETLTQLANVLGLPPAVQLKMRRQGDFTPDDELKQQWLNEMPASDRLRLVAVFDDRDKVVAMWRKNGIACFQVAPGGF